MTSALTDIGLDGRSRYDLGLKVERVAGRRYLNGGRILLAKGATEARRAIVRHIRRQAWRQETWALLKCWRYRRETIGVVKEILMTLVCVIMPR